MWIVVAAATVGLVAAWDEMRRRRAATRQRAAWGSARPPRGDEDQIARYHRSLVEVDPEVAEARIGDQAWTDLGLNDVLAELDRTSSSPGQQMLYHRLRVPARSLEQFASLGEFETVTQRFCDDVSARERAQKILARLDDSAAYALPRLFLAQLPRNVRIAWLFPVLLVAPIGALAAALAGVAHGWAILLLVLVVNFVIRNLVAAEVAWIAEPFRALHSLMDVADALAHAGLAGDVRLEATRGRLARLRRITSFISTVENGGDVFRAFVDYFNMLFLVDLNVFVVAHGECERRREEVRAIFEAVGNLDSALSVASYRAGRELWCRPVILPAGRGMDAAGLVHPLLPDAHANDVKIAAGQGIVITGSNMSGKTTLLRAVGVNAVLAQTIHTCTARRFACGPVIVQTAIALSDNLLDGKSYYLVEASTVLGMVRVTGTAQHLYLVDELFRGTNTVERIAAGVAVMEALVTGSNMAMVATHDGEVVQLVSDTYDAWHFAESVTPSGFAFDFVLRRGTAVSRNAISLLRTLGAPASITDRATEICSILEEPRIPVASQI